MGTDPLRQRGSIPRVSSLCWSSDLVLGFSPEQVSKTNREATNESRLTASDSRKTDSCWYAHCWPQDPGLARRTHRANPIAAGLAGAAWIARELRRLRRFRGGYLHRRRCCVHGEIENDARPGFGALEEGTRSSVYISEVETKDSLPGYPRPGKFRCMREVFRGPFRIILFKRGLESQEVGSVLNCRFMGLHQEGMSKPTSRD